MFTAADRSSLIDDAFSLARYVWQWQHGILTWGNWRNGPRQRQHQKSLIWLVDWRKIIGLLMRHAFWCNFLTKSVKQWGKIFIFEVQTTAPACSRKSFFLCLYMKTIGAKQAKLHFAYFVQLDQHGLITSSILMWRFRCSRSSNDGYCSENLTWE